MDKTFAALILFAIYGTCTLAAPSGSSPTSGLGKILDTTNLQSEELSNSNLGKVVSRAGLKLEVVRQESSASRTNVTNNVICLGADGSITDGTTCGSSGGCCPEGFRCADNATVCKKKACFTGAATVELENGVTKTMRELNVGDRVRVGANEFSDVFLFTHADADHRSKAFVTVTAENGRSLTASYGHYVYAASEPSEFMKEALPIEKVSAGTFMFFASGAVRVADVKHNVDGSGLYNPQTLHGDIVVDGFLATTYTSAIEPSLAHTLLAPVRAVYGLTKFDATSVFEKVVEYVS